MLQAFTKRFCLLTVVMLLSVVNALADNVAKIGDTEYATLQAAFDAAKDGETVTLLGNYDATSESMAAGTRQFVIKKSITFDGGGYTLTTKQRGIAVGNVHSDLSNNISVTFRDITIKNATSDARCIDTRGKIGTLTLDKVTLNTQGATGYTQPLTIGGNQATPANVIVTNGSVIQTNEKGNAYYSIVTFNPVNMTIEDSTIKGWACIYAKGQDSSAGSAGSTFTINNSTLVSTNEYSGETNSFAAFTMEDNDVTINVTNSNITLNNTGDQTQAIAAAADKYGAVVTGAVVNLGEGNEVTFAESESGTFAFALNYAEVKVSGGEFNVEVPEDCCADGYIPTTLENGKYGVKEGSFVAQIDDAKYETLQAAIDAASADDVIELLKDFELTTVTSHPSNKYNVEINKSITIDGKGFKITSSQGKRPLVLTGAGNNIILKDLTVINKDNVAALWISNALTCTLDNTVIDGTNYAGDYNQVVTISKFSDEGRVVLNVTNGSVIKTNDEGKAHYAFFTNHPTDINVTNSTIKGWAAVYVKSPAAGTNVTISNSTLVSSNAYSGVSNAFAAFVMEDNDVTINVTNSNITINNTGDQPQAIAAAVVTGAVVNLGEGNEVTFVEPGIFEFALNYAEVKVSGGTYNVDPSEYVVDGYEAVAKDGKWKVGKIVVSEKAFEEAAENADKHEDGSVTYTITPTVADSDGKTIGDSTTDEKEITVAISSEETNVAEGASLDNLKMANVLTKAIQTEGAAAADKINVSIAVVAKDKTETAEAPAGTVVFDVHPEATVTVNNQPNSPVELANSDLADGASFTFTLNVDEKFEDGATVKVVHKSDEFGDETFYKTVSGKKVSITVTHFSIFELSEVSDVVPANISEVGYATFSSTKALDFTDITTIHAYTAEVKGNKIVFTRIYQVPANTGLLIRNPNGASAVSADVPVIDDIDPVSDNDLVAVDADIANGDLPNIMGDYSYYILNKVDGVVGFYRPNGWGVAKGRAYLKALTASVSAVQSFTNLFDGETTAIDSITTADEQTQDNVFYDLSGRRVNNPQRGLYIVNGKKVLVK